MSQIIIGIAGKKTSGKSTLCNMLHGHQLMSYEIIKSFDVSPDGKLLAELYVVDEKGRESTQKGELDITREDGDFAEWASFNVWPFVKHYAFARPFKEILIEFFDLRRECIYGTDEQKNELTQYLWQDMPLKIKGKSGPMSHREMMQYFGGDLMRKIKPSVWSDFAIKMVTIEKTELAIFSDVRHLDEVEAIKKNNGIIIKLLKNSESEDNHSSEKEVESIEADLEIDNSNLTPLETYQKVLEFLENQGHTTNHVQYTQPSGGRKYVKTMK